MPDIYRCTQAFTAPTSKGPRVVGFGDLVTAADPIYAGREHLFEPVEVAAERAATEVAAVAGVERASAAPGERRAARRVRKPRPAERADDPVADPGDA